MSWNTISATNVTPDHIRNMAANQIAAVRIPNFLTMSECTSIVAALSKKKSKYPQGSGKKIGLAQSAYFPNFATQTIPDPIDYFKAVKKAERERDKIASKSLDLLNRVLLMLTQAWPFQVERLSNQVGQLYFAGIFRFVDNLLLHSDWVPRDAPNWDNATITTQLALNVYLEVPETGGELNIYERLWEPKDETYKRQDTLYGYYPDVVKGCNLVTIKPICGDLLLFNSRNFHNVTSVPEGSQRISFGSHLGLFEPSNTLVIWA